MTLLIGVVSQKGGVGKSTLARLIAREYSANEWYVKIADMDISQGTCWHWNTRRMKNKIQPDVTVQQFSSVDNVLRVAKNYDLVVFDGAPHSTKGTLQISEQSDVVILPTGVAKDDLDPTIRLANELRKKGTDVEKIAITLWGVGDSKSEIEEAKDYVKYAGYYLLPCCLQLKTGYRRANDVGRALTETNYASLNKKADMFVQAVVDRINYVEKDS